MLVLIGVNRGFIGFSVQGLGGKLQSLQLSFKVLGSHIFFLDLDFKALSAVLTAISPKLLRGLGFRVESSVLLVSWRSFHGWRVRDVWSWKGLNL